MDFSLKQNIIIIMSDCQDLEDELDSRLGCLAVAHGRPLFAVWVPNGRFTLTSWKTCWYSAGNMMKISSFCENKIIMLP